MISGEIQCQVLAEVVASIKVSPSVIMTLTSVGWRDGNENFYGKGFCALIVSRNPSNSEMAILSVQTVVTSVLEVLMSRCR